MTKQRTRKRLSGVGKVSALQEKRKEKKWKDTGEWEVGGGACVIDFTNVVVVSGSTSIISFIEFPKSKNVSVGIVSSGSGHRRENRFRTN